MIKRILISIALVLTCNTFLFADEGNKNTTNLHTANLLKINKSVPIYSEDKQSIAITKNQPEFIIKLKSNPTTGYSWFLREYDNNLVTPVKHNYQKSDQKIGALGYEIWTFHIKPAGFVVPQQTAIRLVYTRPWQGTDGSTQVVFRVSTQTS